MKILFQEIINKAIEMKASDVHFIPVKNGSMSNWTDESDNGS
ncbi:hypothetical protein UM606_05215 [Staphylococcus aureus]|nr:hypothetical protein UM606_05215 [Staphylococcus aureus]